MDTDWTTAHRPWPLPAHPWVMFQRWEDLLFAHWPMPPELLRPFLPASLSLDTYRDRAWLAITPFRVTDLHARMLPPLPGVSSFPELNVRTYATAEGKPGVFFLSLDADSRLAVLGARVLFHLPYFTADMSVRRDAGSWRYSSRRTQPNAPAAEFVASYRAASDRTFQAAPGSLEHFLIERYCLYTTDSSGRLYRGEIHHPPWVVQAAACEIERNSMAEAHGLTLPAGPPHLLLALPQPTRIWSLERVAADRA
jgi:uncharacterized protein YqjF (DUF2071 family)